MVHDKVLQTALKSSIVLLCRPMSGKKDASNLVEDKERLVEALFKPLKKTAVRKKMPAV